MKRGKNLNQITAKFVDDNSHTTVVKLDEDLEKDNNSVFPVTHYERTGHKIKDNKNQMQKDINTFKEFIESKNMILNTNKSYVMRFNFSRKKDFFPKVEVNGEVLQVVLQSKILGIVVENTLKLRAHVEYICNKARRKIFILTNMMSLSLEYKIILDVYLKEIRPIIEYGAVVFHSGLTRELSNDLENIQRNIFKILSKYIKVKFSYTEACIFFEVDFLFSRRQDLCYNWVKRYLKEHGDQGLFLKRNKRKLRGNIKVFQEPKYKTLRFFNSPVNYLTLVANDIVSKNNIKNKTRGAQI